MHAKRSFLAAALVACSFVSLLGTASAVAETATCPSTPHPRRLYVAPWGSDFQSNGYTPTVNSFDSPWKTLKTGFRRLCPGDLLLVRGGTYMESVGWGIKPGTSSYPITVIPYQNEKVTLKGTLQLVKANYWTVGGFHITRDPSLNGGRTEFLVKFGGGTGWRFVNSEVWGSRGVSNIMISGSSTIGYPSHYRLVGNCIHDNDATGDAPMNDHNIYLYPGYKSGPGLIERNIFFNAENGAHIKAAGPTSSTGAAYVTIRYNTMVRAGTGIGVGFGSNHISMVRNLIGSRAGTAASYSAAMHGNHVYGIMDAAGYSGVWGFAHAIDNTDDSTTGIRNTGHIVWVHPVFDSSMSCSGFHPQDSASKPYGRFA